MSSIVWKGADDDDNSSRHTDSVRDNSDSDSDDSDDDDEDDDDDSYDSEDEDGAKDKKKDSKKNLGLKLNTKNMSRREEMDAIRAHFDTTDADRTPLGGESLRDFYRCANLVCLSLNC
jgi:hypothetical protein